MTLAHRVLTGTTKGVLRLLCRVDDAQLAKVPDQGPLIFVTNHTNFLDAPLLFVCLQPRPVAGFAKAEVWDNPILRFLAHIWKPIPLRRGEVDRTALRRAEEALEEGMVLGLAPEGTRSGDGRLQQGNAGVVLLALRSGAPVLPLVHYGGELFWHNVARLHRTDFQFAVGRPFYLEAGGTKVTREVRRQMTDEIMYQIAALLPPDHRGVYSDLASATQTYLRFLPGSQTSPTNV
jgi:1-acyl-sn-glycerol-3-phosphate acyltransferase